MTAPITYVLGAPGEAEMPLLADLGARADVRVLAVVDPTGVCLGGAIAEIMGLPVLASLADVEAPADATPTLVLPSGPPGLVADLSRQARDRAFAVVRADEVRAEIARPRPDPGNDAPAELPLRDIDEETAALQASLDDLEDALAGDTIMRRLVELCTSAVGASGGSIMLFDETSRELYIAYAAGLSEGTIHGTRLKLGEGIAGRVAHTREAELVEGRHGPEDRHRDRPAIATAISTPLVAGDELLGVLNVSTQTGEPPLGQTARDSMVGLAARLSRILHEVLQLQRQRTGRMFHLTEQQLRRHTTDSTDLPEMLVGWAGTLAVTTEADLVCLAVPCDDGSVLLAECDAGLSGQHWYEPLHNPAWLEVLGAGLPVVARQQSATVEGRDPLTAFYLPIGRASARAGVSLQFSGARRAHAFRALAGETAFLLDRLLPDLLSQRAQAHRAAMLARLSTLMTELTSSDATPGTQLEHLCDVVRDLTGARYSVAIAELGEELPRLAGGNAPENVAWLREVGRLLAEAEADGWRITTLETRDAPLSVLVATNPAGGGVPGLVLVGKERTHELDGRVFTPLDAELVLPLASLLGRLMPRPREEDDGLLVSIAPLAADIELAPAGVRTGGTADAEERLREDLAREMDRCDRYHNVCGVIILAPDLPGSPALDLLAAAARRLSERLRASDRVYTLPAGEMVLLVPEEIRNLKALQERIVDDLKRVAGDPELHVRAARAAYPSVKGPADAFLATLHDRLGV